MIIVILEAALRALFVAVMVGAGIWALRVCNVVAQKIAWVLALCAALAMPLVMRWQILPNLTLPRMAAAKTAPIERDVATSKTHVIVVQTHEASHAAAKHFEAPVLPATSAAVAPQSEAPQQPTRKFNLLVTLETTYLVVLMALLLRLGVGIYAAMRLWMSAKTVNSAELPLLPDGSAVKSVRMSERVHSPATIGGGIVLPVNFNEWSEEKLRVVLVHEDAHVRQRDFYLQLAAGIHAALFWFSPLGWWLKRKLTELSETISDGAAVRAAQDAESYAQVLLEFAALPRPLFAGVAMARQSNLASRIEQLLNEAQFKTAFAEGRVRMYMAGVLVPLALLAATVHVQAAGQQSGTADAQQTVSSQQQTTTNQVQAGAPATGETTKEPKTMTVQVQADSPESEKKQEILIVQDGNFKADGQNGHRKSVFNYSVNDDGDSWALVEGHENDANLMLGEHSGIEMQELFKKARKMAKGDFFWFTRDGKSYVVDDPETLKEIDRSMSESDAHIKVDIPRIELPEKFEIEMKEMQVPSKEELKRDLKDLDETIKKLDAKLGNGDTQKDLAELQAKLGELEGKLGMMEEKLDATEQEKIQKEVNVELAKANEQQAEAMKAAEKEIKVRTKVRIMTDDSVKGIIEECLKNGKARLVE